MKFTLSWLKDHLETDASLEAIVDTLTMIGLEVEHVDDRAAFAPFRMARVVEARRHPDADKLQVLMVDTGEGEPVQVVCGAPNARQGLLGVFAPPGAYVPGIDTVLSVGRIRGVESFGMMCSERELKLSDEHDGIIDLPGDVPAGTSYAEYAGMNDPVIEIGLTPNRPDCTGVHGIARDLAAAGIGTLKDGSVEPLPGAGASPVKVELQFGEGNSLCRGFALRSVAGVTNGASPAWLQKRLRAIGLRPINALVDITNYITFDRGRPLHVFDAAKVKGDLTVRRAREGETLLALDGQEYKLNQDMCVIADGNGPESLAGIIGGEASGCDETTTDVLIESALWEPSNIARTGRDLGIITDARYRFERGVDPDFMEPGLDLATKMVLDLCGGEPSEKQIAGFDAPDRHKIVFPVSEIGRLTGLDLPADESLAILERLGFQIADNKTTDNTVTVTVPTWRPDVEGKADLVEEVMRIHGINEIAPQPMTVDNGQPSRLLTSLQSRTRLAKRALAARGMMEAVTWSFIAQKAAISFGDGQEGVRLANPIAADMSHMRPSLLPGLIAAAQRNADRGIADLALFEVSAIYRGDAPEDQRMMAAGVRRGTAQWTGAGRDWSGDAAPVGVFDAKADAFTLLDICGLPADRVQLEEGGPAHFHPGRSATIRLGPKNIIGVFGEFHPSALETLDADGPLCGFEINLGAIPEARRKPTRTKPPLTVSALQPVRRDFAFLVSDDVPAADLERAARSADKKQIVSARVFDVFQGAGLGEGKKSLAVEVIFQPEEKAMTEEDFDALSARIIASVEKATGGTLRGQS